METSEKVFCPVDWAGEVALKLYYFMNVRKNGDTNSKRKHYYDLNHCENILSNWKCHNFIIFCVECEIIWVP